MGLNSSEVFICYHALRNILGRRNFLNSSHYPDTLCREGPQLYCLRKRELMIRYTLGIGDNQRLDNVIILTTIGKPQVYPKRIDTRKISCYNYTVYYSYTYTVGNNVRRLVRDSIEK
jgi:hypothetical protein